MIARDIMRLLLEGKKVGESNRYYVYLNIDGDLMSSIDTTDPGNLLSNIIYYGEAKVVSEEGP